LLIVTSAHIRLFSAENRMKDMIKDRKYNQGYLATMKYEKQVI